MFKKKTFDGITPYSIFIVINFICPKEANFNTSFEETILMIVILDKNKFLSLFR